MSVEIKTGWKLKSLSINFMEYGDYRGKHVGKIEFTNHENDAFVFNLSPEETLEYVELISKKVVTHASHLGDKLLASLNLLPAPKTMELEANNEVVTE